MGTSFTCNLQGYKCHMTIMNDHKETYIGKTVGYNVASFKSRINHHVSDCRTGTSTCKVSIQVYYCATKNKCLEKSYFHLSIMMKLKDSQEIDFNENHFHKKCYNTINCPEYLKNI